MAHFKHVEILNILVDYSVASCEIQESVVEPFGQLSDDLKAYARLQVSALIDAAKHKNNKLSNTRAQLIQAQRARPHGRGHSRSVSTPNQHLSTGERLRNRLEGLKHMASPGGRPKVSRGLTSPSVPVLAVDVDSPPLTSDLLHTQSSIPPKEVTRRREDFLMVCSRPPPGAPQADTARQQWNRLWVVLSSGQLSEYNDWRGGPLSNWHFLNNYHDKH